MRRLKEEPKAQPRNVSELLGLAMSIEEAAVERYTGFAVRMEKLSEALMVGTFRALIEEQRDNIEEIARRTSQLTGLPLPVRATDASDLPTETVTMWDEAAASATLTPYRALGIAVENEMEVFAFYSYITAKSADVTARATAEWLAGRALAHAAVLRKERRRVYHRDGAERVRDPMPELHAASLTDFESQSRALEAAVAANHRRIAARLAALHEAAASATVAAVVEQEERQAGGLSVGGGDGTAGTVLPTTPKLLLREALRQAELLHNAYLDLADSTRDQTVLAAAQQAAARTLIGLSTIAAAFHSAID